VGVLNELAQNGHSRGWVERRSSLFVLGHARLLRFFTT
jgi:hypothetical protein